MSETARLLRWFVPGALFLLLYGVWFLLDSSLADRAIPDINTGTAAILAGSAIPIGFVIGMIAAEITWCRWSQWWLQTIDFTAVAEQITDKKHIRDQECLAGIVDVRVHEAYREDEQPHVLHRVRSLTDLYQGLGHGSVAAVLVLVPIAVTLMMTRGDGWCDVGRCALAGVYLVVCLLIAAGMCRSHRRVIRIAEAMANDILARRG